MSTEAKRERKSTTFFEAEKKSEKKAVEIVEGSGVKLGDNEHFCNEIDKVKGDDEVIKSLHSLLFSGVGRKLETKKHIRAFSGFDSTVLRNDKIDKVTNNKKWTNAVLKTVLGWIGLERGGTRDELIVRLVDFLMKPTLPKASTAAKKRKATSSTSKATKKTGKRTKKDKNAPKKAPSAYILFVKDRRAEIKAANPSFSFQELAQAVGAAWNALSDTEKEKYTQKAAEAKAALQAAGGDVADAVDEDGEEESESADEAEEEGQEGGDKDEDGDDKDLFRDSDEEA